MFYNTIYVRFKTTSHSGGASNDGDDAVVCNTRNSRIIIIIIIIVPVYTYRHHIVRAINDRHQQETRTPSAGMTRRTFIIL